MSKVGILMLFLCTALACCQAAEHTALGLVSWVNTVGAQQKSTAAAPPDEYLYEDDLHGAFTVIPPQDRFADALTRIDPTSVYDGLTDGTRVFSAPVPALIHRVLRFDESDTQWQGREAWLAYARQFNATVLVHRPDDVLADTATDGQWVGAVQGALDHDRPDVAEHLTGLRLLSLQGGIWIGPQVLPPETDGQPVSLGEVLNLKGLTVTTNLRARNVGNMSAYITTALMAAPAGHPWLREVAHEAVINTRQLMALGKTDWPRRYFAGNAFLSRQLTGVFHLLNFKTLQDLKVFPANIDGGTEDALD